MYLWIQPFMLKDFRGDRKEVTAKSPTGLLYVLPWFLLLYKRSTILPLLLDTAEASEQVLTNIKN